MTYNTGILIGRAFSLAARVQDEGDAQHAASELCDLADGDRWAIVVAQARFREFVAESAAVAEEQQALELLEAALHRFDSPVRA